MIILGLFTKYFLILMVLLGAVAAFIDAPAFKQREMKDITRKARIIGYGSILLGIFLYVVRILK